MNLALIVGTFVGAIANVLALWLALRARRRRLGHMLDREIRNTVWEYAWTCHKNGTQHSLSCFSPAEIAFSNRLLRAGDSVSDAIQDASFSFVKESLSWRLESYCPSVPLWTLRLLPPADARRYNLEWAAHLRELLDDGDHRRLRADRRKLGLLAICLAVVIRARHTVR